MKTIKCPLCDEEIMIVPQLRMMRVAIDNHLGKHELELINQGLHEGQIELKLMQIRNSLDSQVLVGI